AETMVMCDACHRWVHQRCDARLGADNRVLSLLEKQNADYICPPCHFAGKTVVQKKKPSAAASHASSSSSASKRPSAGGSSSAAPKTSKPLGAKNMNGKRPRVPLSKVQRQARAALVAATQAGVP